MRPDERVEQTELRLASVGREERVVEDDLDEERVRDADRRGDEDRRDDDADPAPVGPEEPRDPRHEPLLAEPNSSLTWF